MTTETQTNAAEVQPKHMPNRLRIVGDGTMGGTRIEDVTTGETIRFVRSYTVTQHKDELAHAFVEVLLPEINLECDATIVKVAGNIAPDQRPKPAPAAPTTGETSQNKQLGDQVSKAPSLTPADIEALVSSEHYFTATHGVHGTHEVTGGPDGWTVPGPLNLLTFCVLVLRNGHTVTGESFCADPNKFNAQTGRVEARKVAINKLWPMAVYAERERLKNTAIIELKDHPSEADMAIFKAYWEEMTKGSAS